MAGKDSEKRSGVYYRGAHALSITQNFDQEKIAKVRKSSIYRNAAELLYNH